MRKITDSDIPLISELLKELTIAEVARKFNVMPSSIHYHMDKHNIQAATSIKLRNETEAYSMLKAIKSDISKGLTTTIACQKHGITTAQYQYLNRVGLKTLKAKAA